MRTLRSSADSDKATFLTLTGRILTALQCVVKSGRDATCRTILGAWQGRKLQSGKPGKQVGTELGLGEVVELN